MVKLVVIDEDERYLHSLTEYIDLTYPEKFDIVSFSNKEYWQKHLDVVDNLPDIVLISEKMYQTSLLREDFFTVLIYEEKKDRNDIFAVSKYQRADELVAEVMKAYAVYDGKEQDWSIGCKNSKIITVFSSQGGAGKTVVAAGLSIAAIWHGKKAFYLNIEDISCITTLFKGDNELNFSSMIYYLKQKKDNLRSKIQEIRSIDDYYKVHFFQPVSTYRDLDQDLNSELTLLLSKMQELNEYDYIFIDMPSRLNTAFSTLIENSDLLLLIETKDPLASERQRRVYELISSLPNKGKHKIWRVLNRNVEKKEVASNSKSKKDKYNFIIPEVNNLIIPWQEGYRIDMNSEFGGAINYLLESVEQFFAGKLEGDNWIGSIRSNGN